ncbi:MAG: hypothetical protein ACO1TE_24845 [Prosthecobacter sp.]
MQLTVEIDDETYAGLEVLAKREHATIGSVVKRAIVRLPGLKSVQPAPVVKMPHGYSIPVSESVPFTSEDVYRIEEELYREGKA